MNASVSPHYRVVFAPAILKLSPRRVHDRTLRFAYAAQPVLAVFLVEIGVAVTVAQGLLCLVEFRFYGGRLFRLSGAQGFDGAVPLLEHGAQNML